MLLLLVHSFVRLALIAIGGGGEASWKASPFGVQESKRTTEMSEIGKKKASRQSTIIKSCLLP
jgi:hypothetical protein